MNWNNNLTALETGMIALDGKVLPKVTLVNFGFSLIDIEMAVNQLLLKNKNKKKEIQG